jgi:hypothetical protein
LPSGNFQEYRRQPKMNDLEVVALSISAEMIGIDSEDYLFGKLQTDYKADFPDLPDRSNYNRRRRRLAWRIEQLNKHVALMIDSNEQVCIVDSIPIPICKIVREKRSRICREQFETSPEKGYSAISKSYFFGYKLHMLITRSGVYRSMDMTKANVHDIHYLNDIKYNGIKGIDLVGDKGYLAAEVKTDLFNSCNIKLHTPSRQNQKEQTTWQPALRKCRKRIETLFSQLCDQFMLKRNYAKSFLGVSTRIISKMAGVTMLQYINLINHKPLNKLKYALA